jgi:tRNA-splicing ligase RtcB
MKKVISTERVPIKMWLDEVEEGALQQAKNVANLPFVFRHTAIMPDAHSGYGVPIGSVFATKGVIVIGAIGVDIGCGMCAAKADLYSRDLSSSVLKAIMSDIREAIPVGFNWHKRRQGGVPSFITKIEGTVIEQENSNLSLQLGTLGGGNHFIEIQVDEEGMIWIMVHSGSRNIGKKVADHYNKIAVELNERWFSSVPKKHQLAFLPLDSEYGKAYMREMQYCVDFALANRRRMMDVIEEIFARRLHACFGQEINIAHNYAAMEHHFGKNVLVHRKGATRAYKGELGIIPGSQGTASYIVRGLGNKESFMSCSHGAGRKMGRKQAQRELDLKEEQEKLKGILHSIRGVKDLDEASGAYKDIDVVMENQEDLVEIVYKLEPLAVVKG